jgi:pilus assembly protein CpaC
MTFTQSLRDLALACSMTAVSALLVPITPAEAGTFERDLQLGVGKSVIVDLPEEASEIYVGDPKVANTIARSARRIYVTAISNGQTSIFALGSNGEKIAIIEVSVGRDINVLSQLLNAALPTNDVHVRTVSDNIILTGSVASAGDMAKALDIANGFVATSAPAAAGAPSGGAANPGAAAGANGSSKVVNALTIRGLDQVAVKVTVSEIRRDIVKQLGVNLAGASGLPGTSSFNIMNPFSINGAISTNQADLGWISGGNSLTSTLQAFERQGVSHVLAEPVITAVSGESAKFLAGGTIPIPTSETCSNVCQLGFAQQPYGVTLDFTPVVLSEGRIQMRIATEVTDVDYSSQITIAQTSIPGFKTRRNETTVELPSGGSMATAGLISSESAQAFAGVPGVMNLPVLGALFRSRDYLRQETELLIMVTPYIVHPVDPKAFVRPDEHWADSTDPQAWLLGRVNRIYASVPAGVDAPVYAGRIGFIAN